MSNEKLNKALSDLAITQVDLEKALTPEEYKKCAAAMEKCVANIKEHTPKIKK